MYFTLLFDKNPEGPSIAYELVYHPCPMWVYPARSGSEDYQKPIVVPNQAHPYYQEGHLKKLLECESLNVDELHSPIVQIICHQDGHGTDDDLDLLLTDLKDEGFLPEVYNNKKL